MGWILFSRMEKATNNSFKWRNKKYNKKHSRASKLKVSRMKMWDVGWNGNGCEMSVDREDEYHGASFSPLYRETYHCTPRKYILVLSGNWKSALKQRTKEKAEGISEAQG